PRCRGHPHRQRGVARRAGRRRSAVPNPGAVRDEDSGRGTSGAPGCRPSHFPATGDDGGQAGAGEAAKPDRRAAARGGMSMAEDRFEIGIVVVKRRLKGPWASHAWLPHAILAAAPAAAPWTRLGGDAEAEQYYAGAFEVALHPSETAH